MKFIFTKGICICFLFVILCLFNQNQSIGQNLTLSGVVIDDQSEALPAATVVLLTASDSTINSFCITNDEGHFKLSQLKTGNYILQISYTGLSNFSKAISLNDTENSIHLDDIILVPSNEVLQEVTIEAKHIPIGMRGDTISYNANAFDVGPGATVEDLLKKLPGIEIERDGSIKAQGEDVESILVDGKEFFGNDPKIATQNLDAEAVSKVDVFDKKSDVEEFTGIDDGVRSRTINLELKEGYKKGGFGKLELNGGGKDFSYKSKLNYFRFNEKMQASVISYANNVNEQTLTLEDQLDFIGGLNGLIASGGALLVPNDFGFSEGVNNSIFTGLQLNFTPTQKFEIQNRYSIKYGHNNLKKRSETNSFSESIAYTTLDSLKSNKNDFSHTFFNGLTYKINPNFHFIMDNTLNLNHGNQQVKSNTQFLQNEIMQGNSSSKNLNDNFQVGINSKITLQSKFKKRSRNWINIINPQYYITDKYIEIDNFLNLNQEPTITLQNQFLKSNQTFLKFNSTFTEPLSKKLFMSFFYDFDYENEQPNKSYYDVINNEEVENENLGAEFTENVLRHQPGIALKRNTEDLDLTLRLAAEFIFVNDRAPSVEGIKRSYQYFTPAFSIRHIKSKHMTDFTYNTTVNLPDIYQLLPVVNNIDPQLQINGNPSLNPEYVHRMMLGYNYYNQFNLINIFSNVMLNYTHDKIVNETIIGDDLIKYQMPVNSKNYWNFQSSIGLSAPLKPLRMTSQLNYRAAFSKSEYIINGIANNVKTTNQNISLQLSNTKQEKVLVEPGFIFDFYSTKYDLNKDNNTKTINSEFYLDIKGYLPKSWVLGTTFTLQNYTSNHFNESPRYYLLNAEIQKFFKEERWSLKFEMTDILDQNKGFVRNSDANSIQQEQYNTVGRYFLLGVTCNLKKKSKEETLSE